MNEVNAYIAHYDVDSSRIRFAWNGQHAERFEDTNQEFRRSVLARTLEQPELAPYALSSLRKQSGQIDRGL